METMHDIKRRIKSVENTKKITKAMKMVAAAKLRRAQEKAESARPFFKRTRLVLQDIVSNTGTFAEHPLLGDATGEKTLLVTITGDRGLCGAYNSRVIKETRRSLLKREPATLLTIGKKALRTFSREQQEIVADYTDIDDYPGFWFARRITNRIIDTYKQEGYKEARLIYTHFDSPLNQTVYNIPLLPVIPPEERDPESRGDADGEEGEEGIAVDYLYEPSPPEVLDVILPQYVNNLIYAALLESKASEFGARMTAMDSATENATEMIDDLTLEYNRARQAQITKEISEIVSGAEAQK